MRIWTNGKPWTAAALSLLALARPACSRGGEEAHSDGKTVTSKGAEAPGIQPGALDRAVPGSAPVEAQSEAPIPQDDFGRKIVKTADLGITSEDVRDGAAEAQQVAARFGGTIISAQTYRTDNAVSADLILSIPSEHFEDALDELRGLGEEVTTDTVSGQDVTEEYVDLQSRERNLLAAEHSLLDLYDSADDVQDALSIQRELTAVRGQIEQVQGRIQYLEQSSDMARISLSIEPVASPPKPPPAWDPALIVAIAWNASLTVLQALAAAVLSTLVFGWWFIPLLAFGTWWLGHRRRGRAPQTAEPEGGEA